MMPTRSPFRPVARFGAALALCAAAWGFAGSSSAFAKPAKPAAPAAETKPDAKPEEKAEDKTDPKAEAKALVAYR